MLRFRPEYILYLLSSAMLFAGISGNCPYKPSKKTKIPSDASKPSEGYIFDFYPTAVKTRFSMEKGMSETARRTLHTLLKNRIFAVAYPYNCRDLF